MKKISLIITMAALMVSSCSVFKKSIVIKDVVKEKARIDSIENPARKDLIKEDLARRNIHMENVLVKDVITSANIDYDYCVIVEVETNEGRVECYVFSRNVSRIAKLMAGETRIDISGDFSRFFTMLDEYYTKVEIVNARIKIR